MTHSPPNKNVALGATSSSTERKKNKHVNIVDTMGSALPQFKDFLVAVSRLVSDMVDYDSD